MTAVSERVQSGRRSISSAHSPGRRGPCVSFATVTASSAGGCTGGSPPPGRTLPPSRSSSGSPACAPRLQIEDSVGATGAAGRSRSSPSGSTTTTSRSPSFRARSSGPGRDQPSAPRSALPGWTPCPAERHADGGPVAGPGQLRRRRPVGGRLHLGGDSAPPPASGPASCRRSCWRTISRPPRPGRSTSASCWRSWPPRYPDCWTFAVEGLVGASPELLIRRIGAPSRLGCWPGRPGGNTADDAVSAELLGSAKDIEEHAYAVRSVADVLAEATVELDVPSARCRWSWPT